MSSEQVNKDEKMLLLHTVLLGILAANDVSIELIECKHVVRCIA